MFTVRVETPNGSCTSRNGHPTTWAVRVESTDRYAIINFENQRGGTLHAGASIDIASMDELARRWCRQRGITP